MIRLVLSELDFDYELQALVCSFFSGWRCHVSVLEDVSSMFGDDGGLKNVCFPLLIAIYLGRERICAKVVSNDGYSLHRSVEGLDANKDWHKLEGKKKHPYRTEYKNKLKKLIFCMIRDFPQKHLPEDMVKNIPAWGTMTGVRPTKIVMNELFNGKGLEDIQEDLDNVYCCSEEKSKLCMQIAVTEKDILEAVDYKNGFSLYVGIPFCPTTCTYCSFTSYPMERYGGLVNEYLNALEAEIRETSKIYPDRKLTSVYIGGGTPTALSAGQLDRLLSVICDSFPVSGCDEFTVEAGRPDSITREKLSVLYGYGVNRISVNPQTMQLKTLRLIGREHTPEQIVECFNLAREIGFSNINMDLIIGLPGEEAGDFKDTLSRIGSLKPDSLTIHSLVVKRGSKLRELLEENASQIDNNLYFKGMETDNKCELQYKKDKVMTLKNRNGRKYIISEMLNMAKRFAAKQGYRPYYMYRQKNAAGHAGSSGQENIGFSLPGKESLYNILIMEEMQTILACGAGASTKLYDDGLKQVRRIENVKNVMDYIKRIDGICEKKHRLYNDI